MGGGSLYTYTYITLHHTLHRSIPKAKHLAEHGHLGDIKVSTARNVIG